MPHPSLYNQSNHKKLPSFYQFYTYLIHPSDQPTIISFSNPDNIAPLTHTNALTPPPYTITKHNFI
ncbi:hypothetical protein, partial [Staphylococcus epidermidis]|uniref:hypothetical protein n=1 Tax=Staphylococcus epidermidis TaxID=1282 RepID=UPI0021B2FD98